MDVGNIILKVREFGWSKVTITGGEPLEQVDLEKLCFLLKKENFFITLETSGVVYNKEVFKLCDLLSIDLKTPSSKVRVDNNFTIHHKILSEFGDKTQIKAVVGDKNDYRFVKRFYNRFTKLLLLKPYQLIITPCWNTDQEFVDTEFVKEIISSIFTDRLSVRLIIQQHKIIYKHREGV